MFTSKLTQVMAISAVSAMLLSSHAHAQPVVPGFDANTLAANDDGSTGVITLPFDVNFFGTTYSSLFVNNNGNVTFNAAQSTFTPFGVGAGYIGQPIIAPFFADVDTRGEGSGLTSYGTGTFDGHDAFGVTWPAVGYFAEHTDKLNTFQMILVDRSDTGAGNFDIVFNYNQIQWETGDASGGSNGLGGVSAAGGLSNGTGDPGTFVQLNGSLVNGALIDGGPDALISNTNDGVLGQYVFDVRSGSVVPGTPEPSTWAMILVGFAGMGLLARRASHRKQAAAQA